MDVAQFIEQMKAQHSESLKDMQMPPGVEDYLRERIALGDVETIVFMHKLAWVFGVQAGQASVLQAQAGAQNPKPRIEA